MQTLVIEPTKFSPKVVMDPTGEVFIHGRSILEDPSIFYSPVFKWLKVCDSESLKMEIKLDYMNTSSSKQIYNMLRVIEDSAYIKNAQINWFYEEGDEDILDLGKEFESQLDLNFSFFEYSESA